MKSLQIQEFEKVWSRAIKKKVTVQTPALRSGSYNAVYSLIFNGKPTNYILRIAKRPEEKGDALQVAKTERFLSTLAGKNAAKTEFFGVLSGNADPKIFWSKHYSFNVSQKADGDLVDLFESNESNKIKRNALVQSIDIINDLFSTKGLLSFDTKPENFLYYRKKDGSVDVRIGDFDCRYSLLLDTNAKLKKNRYIEFQNEAAKRGKVFNLDEQKILFLSQALQMLTMTMRVAVLNKMFKFEKQARDIARIICQEFPPSITNKFKNLLQRAIKRKRPTTLLEYSIDEVLQQFLHYIKDVKSVYGKHLTLTAFVDYIIDSLCSGKPTGKASTAVSNKRIRTRKASTAVSNKRIRTRKYTPEMKPLPHKPKPKKRLKTPPKVHLRRKKIKNAREQKRIKDRARLFGPSEASDFMFWKTFFG